MSNLKEEIVKLRGQLKKAKVTVDETEPYDSKKHEDQTRSKLANIFVWGYFGTLVGIIILVILNNYLVAAFHLRYDIIIDIKDIIASISSVIGPSLGFVVGYYFKSSENHNKN